MDAYIVSLLKAWWGDARDRGATTTASTTCRGSPATTRTYQTVARHARRQGQGLLPDGREPGRRLGQRRAAAPGAGEARLARRPRPRRDRDRVVLVRRPRGRDAASCAPRTSAPRCSSCPAAAHTEKDGTFTNTQRLLQWHHKAVEPPGDARSDLWFTYHLGSRSSASSSPARRARATVAVLEPHLGLPDRTGGSPSRAPRRCSRRSTATARTAAALDATPSSGRRLDGVRRAGSTAACYAGRREPGGPSHAAARSSRWVAPEWGWAWPANRRMLYNRASADPDGKPVVGAQARTSGGTPTQGSGPATTSPTSPKTKRARLRAARRRDRGDAAITGSDPFIMQADGHGWLFVPEGLLDGPLPTHYEPHESPVANPLYAPAGQPGPRHLVGARRTRTTRQPAAGRGALPVRRHDLPAHRAPHRRRDEPHPARASPSCSRRCSARSSPELAELRGLEHGGWATIVTARTRDRGARAGHRPHGAAAGRAADRPPGRPAVPLGLPGLGHRRLGQRPVPARRSTPTCTSRRSRRRPATSWPAGARAGRDLPRFVRATTDRGRPRREHDARAPSWPELLRRRGPAAHGLLHRHDACASAARPARSPARSGTTARRTALRFTGAVLRQHRRARRDTWRHVRSSSRRRPARPTARRGDLRWLMSLRRVQALHPRRLPRRVPDRARCSAPSSAPSSCRTTSATAAATASRPARSASSTSARTTARRWKCTLCYDRLKDGLEPACAQACPTESIQFGPLDELRERAPTRGSSDAARARASPAPSSTATTRTTASAAPARSSCCSTSPRSTACRPTRSSPTRDLPAHVAGRGRRRRRPRWRGLAAAFAGRRAVSRDKPAAARQRRAPPRASVLLRPAHRSSAPVWKPEIAWYFFAGGLAGALGSLAAGGAPRGQRAAAPLGLAACAAAADAASARRCWSRDLGRPERFLNMLRVFRPTSPMSVGTWLLTPFGAAADDGGRCSTGSAGLARLQRHRRDRRRRRSARRCRPTPRCSSPTPRSRPGTAAATSCRSPSPAGPPPARRARPLLLTPRRPRRRRPGACCSAALAVEAAAVETMTRRLGPLGEPYHQGKAGRYHRYARILNGAAFVLGLGQHASFRCSASPARWPWPARRAPGSRSTRPASPRRSTRATSSRSSAAAESGVEPTRKLPAVESRPPFRCL